MRPRFFEAAQTFACPVVTLSELLKAWRHEEAQVVDLLKIDVEGAELQVLEGLCPEDWLLVQQLVLEVHDVDGRLAEIVSLVMSSGLEDLHVDVVRSGPRDTFMMWARRRGSGIT